MNDKGETLPKTTQTEADEALKAVLDELDAKVNAFATSSGKALSQNEHDALVVFSYNAGAGWITGSGVVRNAILNGGNVNELLNAFSNWGGYEARRTIEVNMYVNGIYTSSVPSSYTNVVYHANTGSLTQGASGQYTYYYDSSAAVNHPVTPTKSGYKFMGWYNAASNPSVRYDVLNKDCATKTLYALWQKNAATAKNAATEATAVNYTIKLADLLEKREYYTPEIGASSWEITSDVTVSKEFVDNNGQRWGCVHPGGNRWIRLSGSKVIETTDGTYSAFQVKVTVTNSYVNRRVNATAGSAKNGSYTQGTELLIINEEDGWGQVGEIRSDGKIEAVGWVSLMYTNWGSVQNGITSSGNGAVIAKATVTYSGYLNIRAEANTDSKIVGALAKDDTVDIYEIKIANGHQWGRCSNGWICLSYTKVEKLAGSETTPDVGAEAYMYTGKLTNLTDLYTDAVADSVLKIDTESLPTEADVKVLQLKADSNGNLWFKALWYVDKDNDKDHTKETAVTGWTKNFTMDPATYTVCCEELNVREKEGTGNKSIFKLAKGVQVKITEVKLVGEEIWGKAEAHNGWINLASKYVTRGDSIVVEGDSGISTNRIGTVINTDGLRVRKTGASYGAQIGRLSRGTTVAVWEENEDGWFKVDSNQNGTYDYDGDGWVSGAYLDVREGTVGGNSTVTDAAGNKYETDGTGKGVVANTYAGVNVRTGPSTGYASKGKLLPGTIVDILEVSGNGKWGRTAQGWVSLDYITMLSYNQAQNNTQNGSTLPNGGVQVESFDKADKTTTTAVYTGVMNAGVEVRSDADTNATLLRTTGVLENVTIHELAGVKTVVSEKTGSTGTDANGTTTTVTTTETTYWARINDGWVQNPGACITLNALDEKVHTLTGKDTLDMTVNGTKVTLKKGDQVKITKVEIENNVVYGWAETNDGRGRVNLSYFSEGAVYEAPKVQTPVTPPTTIVPPTIGAGSSTGGFVTNTSGYRYTGNVIRTNELNVRANPSTTAAKTTTLKSGQALVVYETTTSEGMAWGRCDAGWVYLYYVDLGPATGAVDARVVAGDNVVAYTDMNCSGVAGTFARQSVVDIYEIVGKMARTDLGWVNVDNLL